MSLLRELFSPSIRRSPYASTLTEVVCTLLQDKKKYPIGTDTSERVDDRIKANDALVAKLMADAQEIAAKIFEAERNAKAEANK